jgi:hypothetical protein
MSKLNVSQESCVLLEKVPPKVIQTEKATEAYTEILYELDQRSKSLSQAEKEPAD